VVGVQNNFKLGDVLELSPEKIPGKFKNVPELQLKLF
jgi:hypothetical protein